MEVSIKKYETVDLDYSTMKEVTQETLKKVYDIPDGAFINEEGFLVVWERQHGSGYDDEIRKATPTDKRILKILKKVEKSKET